MKRRFLPFLAFLAAGAASGRSKAQSSPDTPASFRQRIYEALGGQPLLKGDVDLRQSTASHTVDVRAFGAKGDGVADDSAAIMATISSLGAAGGNVVFPPGHFAITREIVLPSRVTLAGAGQNATIIRPIVGNINLIRCIGSHGGIRELGFHSAGMTNVCALRVTPLDELQLSTVVNQNYNRFYNLVITGADEGIVMQCGPMVSGTASGCWYNTFYNILLVGCRRGVWLKGGPNAAASGVNRNQFFAMRIGHPGTNTGLQIDSGDTNSFFGCSFEGINSGEFPSRIPTALRISSTSAERAANDSNRFFGIQTEACALDLYNGSEYSEFYGCHFSTLDLFRVPKVLLGGYDASVVPQITEWMIFQQNALIEGYSNGAVTLRRGQLAFPTRQIPSTHPKVLDDYEEGRFTPELESGQSQGVAPIAISGKYLKVGKTVFVWLEIRIYTTASRDADVIIVSGLPFPVFGATPMTCVSQRVDNRIAGQLVPAVALDGGDKLRIEAPRSQSQDDQGRGAYDTQMLIQGAYQTKQ